jgi:hypothetical protein
MNTWHGMRHLWEAHIPCLTRWDFKYCARALREEEPERATISCGPLSEQWRGEDTMKTMCPPT